MPLEPLTVLAKTLGAERSLLAGAAAKNLTEGVRTRYQWPWRGLSPPAVRSVGIPLLLATLAAIRRIGEQRRILQKNRRCECKGPAPRREVCSGGALLAPSLHMPRHRTLMSQGRLALSARAAFRASREARRRLLHCFCLGRRGLATRVALPDLT